MLWKTKTTFQFAHFDEWYFRKIADPRFFNNFSALLHSKTWILKVYKQWMNVQCAWLWYKTKRKYGHEINDFFLLKFTRMIKKYFPSNSIFLRPIFLTNKKSALITETFLELLTPWNWALTTWYLSRCVNLYFKRKKASSNYSWKSNNSKVYTTNSQTYANERRRALLSCEFLCKINCFCSKILFYD